MRIGIVNEYFPPYAPGGAEWSSLQAATNLVRRGHHVVAITLNYGDSPSFEVVNGVRLYRRWFPVKMRGGYPISRWAHANPVFHLYLAAQVTRIARKEKVELLHAQNNYSLVGASIAARLLSLPVMVTVRDYAALCPVGICLHESESPTACNGLAEYFACRAKWGRIYGEPRNPIKRLWKLALFIFVDVPDTFLRRCFLKRVDKVTPVSDGVGEIFARSGIRRDLMTTVYNMPPDGREPTTESALRQKYDLDGRKVVFFVGKVSIGKGKDLLFDSIPQVVAQVPDVVFALAGRWKSPEEIPDSCRQSTRYLGVLPNKEVQALYDCADVVVVPSIWPEPLSRVALEAMSAGRALVATRTGGSPELVEDGGNGFVVSPTEPGELAQALITLLKDSQLREQMEKRGRYVLQEKFSGEKSVLKLEAIYQAAVRGSRA